MNRHRGSALGSKTVRGLKTKRGFTLVELLVVISIIGMLMALLLPAVQAARETGRRNTCQSNQHNISLALLQFAEAKKYYPGWDDNLVTLTSAGVSGNLTVSWVVPLFPYMERNDVYGALTSANYNVTNTLVYMPLLICPSNPPTTTTGAPMAYVINGGQSVAAGDIPVVPAPMSSTTAQQTTWASSSGIAYDISGAALVNNSGAAAVKLGQDYIVAHDGSSLTLLLSENDNMANQVYLPATAVTGSPAASFTQQQKYGLVFQWSGLTTATAGASPTQTTPPSNYNRINGNKGTNPTPSAQYARPASNHPGGVVVAFCDGHVRFIAEDIAYYVYKQLMTPYGVGTGDTDQGTAFPLSDGNF